MSDKAIFLDRDGTLIEDPGYISHPDQVKLLDGAAEALIELRRMGYRLIVVSNQSAVARGIVSEKVLDGIHERLKQLLAEKGACLDKIYYCPYHPDGVIPKYRKESDQRKPNPGMLLAAADEMDVDLGQSWSIGNSSRDIEAGLRAGCKTVLIDSPSHARRTELGRVNPDHRAVNIKEAVNIIKKYNRSPGDMKTHNQPAPAPDPEPEMQTTKQPKQMQPVQPQAAPTEHNTAGETTEQLLSRILEQLKSMQRANMFGEFSTMRLLAGIVQIVALLCLLITVWFMISPTRQDNSVFISIGFAMVLQMMALTFYMMQGRR